MSRDKKDLSTNPKIMKKKKIIITILCLILFIFGGCFTAYKFFFDPYRGTPSEWEYSADLRVELLKEQAISEIDYILKRLEKRHPACMKGIPETVLEQARIEKDNLPDRVTVLQLWQASSRILAKMKDGHTQVGVFTEQNHLLPISFRFDSGKLYAADGEFSDCEITHIGGVSVGDLYSTFLMQCSYELESFAASLFQQKCQSRDYLAFLNVDISDSIQIGFQTSSGEVNENFTFELEKKEPEEEDTPFVEYEINKERGLGIFTLKECTFDQIYCDTLEAFFKEIKDNQINTVVVDLRDNGGGDSRVINEFLRFLNIDKYFSSGGADVRYGPILRRYTTTEINNSKRQGLLFEGDVYILTSSLSFSAATDFAAVISDNRLGKIVGEISGGMPSSYGDVVWFQTPMAKLDLGISYKYFLRPDKSKADEPLIPDEITPASEALNKVYEIMDR